MKAILTVVVVVLLAACGLKDDLYLPEADPAESAQPAQSSAIEADAPTSDESEDATNP